MADVTPEGRVIVSIDLKIDPREMADWPAHNIRGFFRAVADAYGHMVTARHAAATKDYGRHGKDCDCDVNLGGGDGA